MILNILYRTADVWVTPVTSETIVSSRKNFKEMSLGGFEPQLIAKSSETLSHDKMSDKAMCG